MLRNPEDRADCDAVARSGPIESGEQKLEEFLRSESDVAGSRTSMFCWRPTMTAT